MNDNEYVYKALHEWIQVDPETRSKIPLGDMDAADLSRILQRAAELKKEVRSDLSKSPIHDYVPDHY